MKTCVTLELAVVELYVIYRNITIVVPTSECREANCDRLVGSLVVVNADNAFLPFVALIAIQTPQEHVRVFVWNQHKTMVYTRATPQFYKW